MSAAPSRPKTRDAVARRAMRWTKSRSGPAILSGLPLRRFEISPQSNSVTKLDSSRRKISVQLAEEKLSLDSESQMVSTMRKQPRPTQAIVMLKRVSGRSSPKRPSNFGTNVIAATLGRAEPVSTIDVMHWPPLNAEPSTADRGGPAFCDPISRLMALYMPYRQLRSSKFVECKLN